MPKRVSEDPFCTCDTERVGLGNIGNHGVSLWCICTCMGQKPQGVAYVHVWEKSLKVRPSLKVGAQDRLI